MKTMTKKQSVADALVRFGVAFNVECGERIVKNDAPLGGTGKGLECFAWRATFTYKRGHRTFDYFTGIGNVTKPKNSFMDAKPVKPCAADVLFALLLDAGALDENFSDWCGNFGYSDDSLAALRTYQQCIDIGKGLRLMFDSAQLAELSAILEDY